MPRFKWIDWNLAKIDTHGLTQADVESAFDRILQTTSRRDKSYEMLAKTAAGRTIRVVWRYGVEDHQVPDIFGDYLEKVVFVITAY
jgi:hypothetical protein